MARFIRGFPEILMSSGTAWNYFTIRSRRGLKIHKYSPKLFEGSFLLFFIVMTISHPDYSSCCDIIKVKVF